MRKAVFIFCLYTLLLKSSKIKVRIIYSTHPSYFQMALGWENKIHTHSIEFYYLHSNNSHHDPAISMLGTVAISDIGDLLCA